MTEEEKPEWALTKLERNSQDFAATLSKIFESKKKEFKAALEKWQKEGFQSMNPDFFKRLIMTAANGNSTLFDCTRNSLYQSALEIAQLQLEPNTTLQEAFLIPYHDKRTGQTHCQVQIGRNGWVKLAYRTGLVSGVNALPVFKGEEFIWQPHTTPEVFHKPDVEIDEDAVLIAVYAWVDLTNGTRIYEILRKKDIDRIRKNIRYNSDAWKKYPDRMACRSAIKRLIRTRLPVNEFLADKQSLDKETHEDDLIIDTYATEPEKDNSFIKESEEAAQRVQEKVNKLNNVIIDKETGEILAPQGTASQPDGADQPQPRGNAEDSTKEKLSVSEFWTEIGKKNEFWDTNITKKQVLAALKLKAGSKTLGQLNNNERRNFLTSIESTMRQEKTNKENEDDNVAF